MNRRHAIRARTLQTAVAAGLLALAGCTAASTADSADGTNERPSDVTRLEDEDRSLASDDDTIVALRTATNASSGEWQGTVLILRFDEGSKDAPTATINCRAVNEFLTSDKSAVLHYPDGQLSCEDVRRN